MVILDDLGEEWTSEDDYVSWHFEDGSDAIEEFLDSTPEPLDDVAAVELLSILFEELVVFEAVCRRRTLPVTELKAERELSASQWAST